MKQPPHGSPQWAARVCINALGVELCSELTGVCTQIVYRWADAEQDTACPLRHAMTLNHATFLRDSIAPFTEIFQANAGGSPNARAARQLRDLADDIEGVKV